MKSSGVSSHIGAFLLLLTSCYGEPPDSGADAIESTDSATEALSFGEIARQLIADQVTRAYRELLAREPYDVERTCWVDLIHGGYTTTTEMRSSLIDSVECKDAIGRVYRDTLSRDAAPWEVSTWQTQLLSYGWTLQSMRAAFAGSDECGRALVDVYQDTLDRTPSAWEVGVWRENLSTGAWSVASMRADFAQSAECRSAIVGVYQSILGRTPATWEIDVWRGKLRDGASIADMRQAFLGVAQPPIALRINGTAVQHGQTVAATSGQPVSVGYRIDATAQCPVVTWNIAYSTGSASSTSPPTTTGTATLAAPSAGTVTLIPSTGSTTIVFNVYCANPVLSHGMYAVVDGVAPPSSGPRNTTYLGTLYRQQVWEGPIPFSGWLPQPAPYSPVGRAKWLRNENAFPIALLLPGRSASDCFDTGASVPLAHGQQTTRDEMRQLFGSEAPALPIAVTACTYAGTSVADTVTISINYDY